MKQKEQTAVEWFFNEIKHILPNDFLVKYEQAKAMEKEQIINAHTNGQAEYDTEAFRPKVKELAEQYYNEEYGGNNEQQ